MNIPQILQQLNRAQLPNLSGIRQMMQMVRSAGNPQAMLQAMAQNNPQVRQVMDIVQKHGGDPMAAFRAEAEARGMNPDEIINMLR